jgi:hypothetical protein
MTCAQYVSYVRVPKSSSVERVCAIASTASMMPSVAAMKGAPRSSHPANAFTSNEASKTSGMPRTLACLSAGNAAMSSARIVRSSACIAWDPTSGGRSGRAVGAGCGCCGYGCGCCGYGCGCCGYGCGCCGYGCGCCGYGCGCCGYGCGCCGYGCGWGVRAVDERCRSHAASARVRERKIAAFRISTLGERCALGPSDATGTRPYGPFRIAT